MKKNFFKTPKPVYTEESVEYVPAGDNFIACIAVMGMIYAAAIMLTAYIATLIAPLQAIIIGLIYVSVVFGAVALIVRNESNKKITVSQKGVIFENILTVKANTVLWEDVTRIEYAFYTLHSKKPEYKIYVKSSEKPHYIPLMNVDGDKIRNFIPHGLISA